MNKKLLFILFGVVMFSMITGLVSADTDLTGVTPGKWTMDFDAARKLAKEKQLPILLNFSGSDWCGWCKLMEKNVFSKPDWQDYAKTNILMVIIDFPKDKKAVPEKYVERNDDLMAKYHVEGYPTFVVLDDDAETELGRLGAGQEKTPASFIAELKVLFRYRPAVIREYVKTLKPDAASKYLAIINQISECDGTIKRCQQQISAAEQKLEEQNQKIVDLKTQAQEFRAAQLGADHLKQYQNLKAELKKAEEALAAWLNGNPQNTEENIKKFETLNATILELSDKLSKY